MDDFFTEDDVIHKYTRKQALEDGFQVDANIGDLAEVTKQHYTWPVYMTREVFGLMEKAVKDPKWGNDFKGVWHDILTMSKHGKMLGKGTSQFLVIITGTGSKNYHLMVAEVVPTDIDDARPAIAIRLADED